MHPAACIQVGPRFAELTEVLRNGAAYGTNKLVPFPDLPEGRSELELYRLWASALRVYYLPIWLFRKLIEDVSAPH